FRNDRSARDAHWLEWIHLEIKQRHAGSVHDVPQRLLDDAWRIQVAAAPQLQHQMCPNALHDNPPGTFHYRSSAMPSVADVVAARYSREFRDVSAAGCSAGVGTLPRRLSFLNEALLDCRHDPPPMQKHHPKVAPPFNCRAVTGLQPTPENGAQIEL